MDSASSHEAADAGSAFTAGRAVTSALVAGGAGAALRGAPWARRLPNAARSGAAVVLAGAALTAVIVELVSPILRGYPAARQALAAAAWTCATTAGLVALGQVPWTLRARRATVAAAITL